MNYNLTDDTKRLVSRFIALCEEIDALDKERRRIAEEIAQAACPFEVGQIVSGHDWQGPRKWEVVKIVPPAKAVDPPWHVRGMRLRVDGHVDARRIMETLRPENFEELVVVPSGELKV